MEEFTNESKNNLGSSYRSNAGSFLVLAMAGKPTPVLNVGSITYEVDGFAPDIDEVVAHNISWQKAHPRFVKVIVRGPLNAATVGYTSQVPAPKGKAGKYPQDVTVVMRLGSDCFNIGGEVDVYVLLTRGKNTQLANSGNLTTLTWGTNSSWTAP